MESKSETEKLLTAVQALEAQRSTLGDEVVDTALAPLREKLMALQATALGEQRKLATILFADLVGFTALSAELDAEEVRDLLKHYFAAWSSFIQNQGGVVEKFIGDAVMAVFGLPVAREDDPERALLAALGMRRELEALNQQHPVADGRRLAMRVGIHTGEILVGSFGERQEGEFVAVGETVNLASRLQAAAPANGILITYDTYRHIRGLFEARPFERLSLKGIVEPVQTYLVQEATPRPQRGSRRGVAGIQTRMVGRNQELARLQALYHETIRSGQRRSLALVGEAGIGKTRLLSEFEGWLAGLPDAPRVLKGRAFSVTQNTPYSLARDVIAAHFDIQESDPAALVGQKLKRGWRQAFALAPGGPAAGKAAGPAYAAARLLGFELSPGEVEPEPHQDARGFYDQALIELRAYFRALASRGPVLLLLEDLHWADDSSLELLNQIGENLEDLPLLVIATTRPRLAERRPGWQEELQFQAALELRPLSKEESLDLIRQILHKVPELPQGILELITASADGNPFYVEELVKMLIEDGVIAVEADAWRVEEALLPGLRVPPTLVGVLQARFDRLPPDERVDLQRGSVIGRIFWDQAVVYLQGEDNGAPPSAPEQPVLEVLQRLQGRQMIFQQPRSTFESTREFSFKHALLRDVTYESLLKRQRRAYHHRAAQWVEQVAGQLQRLGQFAGLIAGHYDQAGEAAAAAEWYWQAGQGAARRYANAEALYAFNRALELLPAGEPERRFEILLAREAVYDLLGQPEERSRDLDELSTLARQLDTPRHQAQVLLRRAAYNFSISEFPVALEAARGTSELAHAAGALDLAAESALLQAAVLIRQAAFETAAEFANLALDLARRQQRPDIQASSLRHLGLIAYYLGKAHEALAHFEQAHHLFVEIGDRQGQGLALNNMGGATFKAGDYRGAQRYYTRSLELCQEIGDRLGQGRALNNLGITAIESGDHDQAERYYLQGLQICRSVGHRTFQVSVLDNLGNLAAFRFQYSKAHEYQRSALEIAREIGDRVNETMVLLNLGHTHLLAGDQTSALNYLEQAAALSANLGDRSTDTRIFISLSDYGLYIGEFQAAAHNAGQAVELARELEDRFDEGQALQCLGSARLAEGQAAEAVEHFRLAIAAYQASTDSGLALEARAGLTLALLALGKPEQALEQVEKILEIREREGLAGVEQPIFVLLACYRGLKANRQPRAEAILQQAYDLLHEIAAQFPDPAAAQAFLENIPANRELLAVWQDTG